MYVRSMRYWQPKLRVVRPGTWLQFDGSWRIAVIRTVNAGYPPRPLLRADTWAPDDVTRDFIGYFPTDELRLCAEMVWSLQEATTTPPKDTTMNARQPAPASGTRSSTPTRTARASGPYATRTATPTAASASPAKAPVSTTSPSTEGIRSAASTGSEPRSRTSTSPTSARRSTPARHSITGPCRGLEPYDIPAHRSGLRVPPDGPYSSLTIAIAGTIPQRDTRPVSDRDVRRVEIFDHGGSGRDLHGAVHVHDRNGLGAPTGKRSPPPAAREGPVELHWLEGRERGTENAVRRLRTRACLTNSRASGMLSSCRVSSCCPMLSGR